MASFEQYLRAAYPVIWVNTLEPHRAEREMHQVAQQVHPDTQHYHWDLVSGFSAVGRDGQPCTPVKAIAMGVQRDTVTFLWNLHRFISSVEVVQTIQNVIPNLKQQAACLVILAPDHDKLPTELARSLVTLDYPLPAQPALARTVEQISSITHIPANTPLTDSLVEAMLGLTESEADDALSLSVVETNALDPQIVAREKAAALLRQTKLTVGHYPDRFISLGGLDNLKEYTLRTARSQLSLGVLLLGVPGSGKSTFARALGNELGIPTLTLDFGRMMGSLVGQSEATIREALKAVDSMGRVVLFIDEMDKGLAGAGSSGELDSGVKAGVTGTFLKWLSDREPGRAYVTATANNIKGIPPEYLRSERWDAMFYLDLPSGEEKDAIWRVWGTHFLKERFDGNRPVDTDWTGAEIRSCCRVAAMMGCNLEEASQYVVPVARSMAEAIEEMRRWAKGRCLPASRASNREGMDGHRKLSTIRGGKP